MSNQAYFFFQIFVAFIENLNFIQIGKSVFNKKYHLKPYFVLGFGGLGQMGVMIAKAMGNNVTVISTSNSKEAMAKKMGADNYIISTNPDSMKAGFKTLDLILSTISATHEVMPYLNLLKIKGTLVVLGAVAVPFKVHFF